MLAEFDETAVLFVCVVEIFLLESERGQAADGIGGIGAQHQASWKLLRAAWPLPLRA